MYLILDKVVFRLMGDDFCQRQYVDEFRKTKSRKAKSNQYHYFNKVA